MIRRSAVAAFAALALSLTGCSDAAQTTADAAVSGAGTGVSTAGTSGTGMVPDAGPPAAGTGASGGTAGAAGAAGGPPPVCTVPDDLALAADDGDDGGVAPDCVNVPRTIVANNCIGGICHHTPNKFQGVAAMLDLMSPCIADRLVNVPSKTCNGIPLIDLQNVENSFLLNKLEAEEPICGMSMPLGDHLPIAQQRCIRAWVNAVVRAWPR